MVEPIVIKEMQPSDWSDVRRIYEEGIATGKATFETVIPDWEHWDKKYHRLCRFVILKGEEACGWIALSPHSARYVYRGVAEVSLYISTGNHGQGLGQLLLKHLIAASEAAGFWTLQATIFPDNEVSIHLHKKLGFRIVGTREKIGQLPTGEWIDNVFMERRSMKVGWPANHFQE